MCQALYCGFGTPVITKDKWNLFGTYFLGGTGRQWKIHIEIANYFAIRY